MTEKEIIGNLKKYRCCVVFEIYVFYMLALYIFLNVRNLYLKYNLKRLQPSPVLIIILT